MFQFRHPVSTLVVKLSKTTLIGWLKVLAGGVGIEPTLLVLETRVLPLNEPPITPGGEVDYFVSLWAVCFLHH